MAGKIDAGQDFGSLFGFFDKKNPKGRVSFEEFSAALTASDPSFSTSELEEIFREAKMGLKGDLTREEFIEFMSTKVYGEGIEEDLITAFLTFDRNGDGYISVEEIQKGLEFVDNKLPPEEIADILRQTDKDGDDLISYLDFKKTMTE